MSFRHVAILTLSLIGGANILASYAHAELILDDFDDPAIAISPEMLDQFVVTSQTGQLNAARHIRVAASAARPSARLDVGAATTSVMTASLSTLNPGTVGLPLLAFQLNYIFSPTDISQAGANDAIIFDFRSIQSNGFVPELGLIVTDDFNLSKTYFAAIRDLPLSSGPFSASMPFSSFTLRNGFPGLPDFTTIKRMDFDFFFLFPPENVQWSAELERIRFGRVPEPDSLALWLFAAQYAVRRSRRGVTSHFKGGS